MQRPRQKRFCSPAAWRRLCVVILLAAASAAARAADDVDAPAEGSPAELKVMTFNLRYASDRPPNAWPQRRPVVRQLLLEAAPDVVGTQEGLYRQIKDLESDLPDFGWIGLGRDGGSRGEFMAIFYRRERCEPLEFDHFWLSDTPDVVGSTTWGNSNRRMVTWARFRDRRAMRELYFVNTHFDHQVQAAREKSAELVRQRVDRLMTRLPVILVGDFNAAAQANRAYDVLVGPDRFRDAWREARQRGDAVGTFHDYRGPRAGGERIDWILLRGPVAAVSSRVETFAQQGQYPSDHFPVTAVVQWQSDEPPGAEGAKKKPPQVGQEPAEARQP